MAEKYISKIRIDNSLFEIKDEELREGIEKLLGPISDSDNSELNVLAEDD